MLTDSQLAALDGDGYVAPLPFCAPGRMAALRAAVEAATATPGPCHGDPWTARHQDSAAVLDICTSPAVCTAVAQVLGPELVIWNSVLMNKAPGDGEIPWHQDHDYEYLSPDVGLAVWLAVDDASEDNGCLEVIECTPSGDRSTPSSSAGADGCSVTMYRLSVAAWSRYSANVPSLVAAARGMGTPRIWRLTRSSCSSM